VVKSEGGTIVVECRGIGEREEDKGDEAVQGNAVDGGGKRGSTIEEEGVFVIRVLFL
jgi:hypothetical protein